MDFGKGESLFTDCGSLGRHLLIAWDRGNGFFDDRIALLMIGLPCWASVSGDHPRIAVFHV